MDFIIRQATEKDYTGLAKLFDELNLLHANGAPDVFVTTPETPQTLEYVRGHIGSKNSLINVAQHDGDIVGFILAVIRESPADIPVFRKRRYVYVENICVGPEYRRASVGKKLMESVEIWAQKEGISHVELNVWDFNKRAMSFFDSIGYEPREHMLGKNIKKNV